MPSINTAIREITSIAQNPVSGYDQSNRWGPNYDCSSLVITVLRRGGFSTGNASYTGDMGAALRANGWVNVPVASHRKGDIMLYAGHHVAFCTSDYEVTEASINEKGGIVGGASGDQTGKEIWTHGWYNYPWPECLRYVGPLDDDVNVSNPISDVDVSYRVRTQRDGWLPEVMNLNDYAGYMESPITDIAIWVREGTIEYQVYSKGRWLPMVTGYNIEDSENGYAGEGKPIKAVRAYYHSAVGGPRYAKYRVAPVGRDWFDFQVDDQTYDGQDGYAGDLKSPIGKFQIDIVS